jgi:predicted GNAT family acetyltransferase
VTAGICKVAPVYTPPRQRGHGYGTAATAAVTRQAIETGAPEVLLFTHATNPVTNSIYQRLGYRRPKTASSSPSPDVTGQMAEIVVV